MELSNFCLIVQSVDFVPWELQNLVLIFFRFVRYDSVEASAAKRTFASVLNRSQILVFRTNRHGVSVSD